MYDVGVPVPPDLLLSPDGDRATAVIWAKGFRQGVSEWDWCRRGFPRVRLRRAIVRPLAHLRAWEVATRLSNPQTRAALARR